MTETTVMGLAGQVFLVTAKVAGPILGATLVIGVLLSLLQAATQVQEMTLTFVPKIVVVAIVLALLGSWMLQSMVDFCGELWSNLPQYGR